MSTKKRTVCFDTKITWLNIARMYNTQAEQYDLSVSVAFVLLHIAEEGTQVTQLAPLVGMEASSMTRILNNIEERGWIERKRDNASDRRAVKIILTSLGIEARELAREKVRHFNKTVQEHTHPADLEAFFRVVDTVNNLISNNQIFETSNSSIYNETNH
jgi:DNA-binding MarR family transcriptional regulator